MTKIALIHPVHDLGIKEQIKEITSGPEYGPEVIEILPQPGDIQESANWDFEELAATQLQLWKEKGEPTMARYPGATLAYFGIAPIPLILHLGYLCNMYWGTAHNRKHGTHSWDWPGRNLGTAAPEVLVSGIPKRNRKKNRKIILIVEVSAQVFEADAREIVKNPLCVVKIKSSLVGLDRSLATEEEQEAVVAKFRDVLEQLWQNCDPSCEIHLFAGIPAGLAFRLGQSVHSSSRHPVVTYKYVSNKTPNRHVQALTLQMSSRPPIRILIAAANSPGNMPLDLQAEVDRILHAINGTWQARHIKVQTIMNATASQLLETILQFRPSILHYAGHSSAVSGIELSRELSPKQKFSQSGNRTDQDLALLFSNLGYHLDLLILNSCESANLSNAILPHVGSVLAMQQSIHDSDAIAFSSAFYQAFARGQSVEQAFNLATFAAGSGMGAVLQTSPPEDGSV